MSPHAGQILQEQVVPRLRSAIPRVVHCVGAEDPEELIQDGTAIAAKMLHNAEAAGKKVTPGNVAYYTIQHLKSGRRSTGSTVVDVLGTGTQLNGSTRLTSLEEPAAMDAETGGEIFLYHDVLSNDREDPATVAARNMDWQTFCSRQSERNLAILNHAAAGEPLTAVADRYGISRSSIQANKNRLAQEIKEFMGPDILKESLQLPGWKHNLVVGRERTAWRKERPVGEATGKTRTGR